MEIIVAGRHTDIPERFREHVTDKLSKLETLAPRAQRIDVEVTHEPNPRQAAAAEKVELTVIGKGPVIRAEACADDRYGALDLAIDKLAERLRRARDRTKNHRRNRVEPPLPDTADLTPQPEPEPEEVVRTADGAVEIQLGDSPVVIREKTHAARPMTVDDALYEMELVGHDFFLFVDADTGQPSVAYRRRGWSYGVIKLDVDGAVAPTGEPVATTA
ncbi:ribosome hibernation-promoting factor, HPF/YfiA family [Cellulomonas denverensis]|uniref:Ribosome hibernation promoting factor n=1 Tax=Cellulomonas denverensis TaxID=264297 RepID=A0A7X6KVH1_9CELL|nr:ribosome-associated translation inhibitor RaiA [Cellulomonas denverensis]NKY22565.1 ribosome-associated translation inhibitor RaiA [Cellulomonas denverensis]GIG24790.1 ribosomal subunit interface protein [Cellulomonas denverensis]